MPDNQNSGMLEDFLLSLAPSKAVEYARTCAQSAKEKGYATYKQIHEAKAVAHTYLAWQDEPGRPLGLAIQAKAFDTSSEAAGNFIRWLKELYEVKNQYFSGG